MKIKIIILAFILLLPIIQTGCWDYEEYEDMAQVSAVGIDFDKKSGKATFTVQYIPTSKSEKGGTSGGPSKKMDITYAATANTLYEALGKIQQVTFKKLFYGYLKVIVIGEDAAKHNMLDLAELHDRTPAIRSTTYLAFTTGKAEDAVTTYDAAMEGSTSEEIHSLIKIANSGGVAYVVSIQDFIRMLAIPGIEATAPRVITVSNTPKPEAKGGTEGNIKFDEERSGDHRVGGMAAFKGDKLVGWLNEKEALGFGWITGKKLRSYKVSEKSGKAGSEDILFYRISKSQGKIKVKLDNDQPDFQVNVKVVADLRKYYGNKGPDFLNPEEVTLMENKLSESIRSDIEAALMKGQKKLKSDIFGFGFSLFRKDWKLWRTEYEKKWDEIFPEMPVTINVQAKIINTGTNNRRLYLK